MTLCFKTFSLLVGLSHQCFLLVNSIYAAAYGRVLKSMGLDLDEAKLRAMFEQIMKEDFGEATEPY